MGAYCIDSKSIYFDGIENGTGKANQPSLHIGPCIGPHCYSDREMKKRMAAIK
jgi:hypothetical protein